MSFIIVENIPCKICSCQVYRIIRRKFIQRLMTKKKKYMCTNCGEVYFL